MTNNVIVWRAIAFLEYRCVTAWWGLGIMTPDAETDFLFQRVILTIKYGATDIGDLVQAVSALANPNLKRNTITWQGRKAHGQWGFNGGRATSSALAAPPLFNTEDYLRNGQQWRAIALPVYATAWWGLLGRYPQKPKLSFVNRE